MVETQRDTVQVGATSCTGRFVGGGCRAFLSAAAEPPIFSAPTFWLCFALREQSLVGAACYPAFADPR